MPRLSGVNMADGQDREPTWCPSGKARAPESVVLGVRSKENGQVTYLASPVPAADIVPAIPPDIDPRRILRFASHCESGCANRSGNSCTLINRLMKLPPEAASKSVPRCHLRPHCQWWTQHGVSACHRCPAVVTSVPASDTARTFVADPTTTMAQLELWIASSRSQE